MILFEPMVVLLLFRLISSLILLHSGASNGLFQNCQYLCFSSVDRCFVFVALLEALPEQQLTKTNHFVH